MGSDYKSDGAVTIVVKNVRFQPLTPFLSKCNPILQSVFCAVVCFCTYFCVYAYRKPYQAVVYTEKWFGGFGFKTILSLGQLVGYTVSKFLAVKYVSEGLVCAAELCNCLFAILPQNFKFIAMALNGLPLGMTYGILVTYIEGRSGSDFILAITACSFIIASGFVKDVGLALVQYVGIYWMPATTGLVFLPPFCIFCFLLHQIPDPSDSDSSTKTKRAAMDYAARVKIIKEIYPGLIPLQIAYFLCSGYRDFRDAFMVEILTNLGQTVQPGLLSTVDLSVGFAISLFAAAIVFVKSNRWGFIVNISSMTLGFIPMGLTVILLDYTNLSPFLFLLFSGIAVNFVYVPESAGLFERMIAYLNLKNTTAAMPMMMTDFIGCLGSCVIFLIAAVNTEMDQLTFFRIFSYLSSCIGFCFMCCSFVYFVFYKYNQVKKINRMEGGEKIRVGLEKNKLEIE